MKASMISRSVVLGLALLLTSSAFAANKGSLQVREALTVSGTQLAPGDYTVKWDGAGPNVELSIMQGKKVVATAPARLIDLGSSPDNNATVVRKSGDGSRSLSEIRFSGKKYALAFGEEAAKADSKTSDTVSK